ncbi:MAG TPA: hypothetical protein VF516_40110 [Kofleriaceae bacterium]
MRFLVWLMLGVSGVAHADAPDTLSAKEIQYYFAPYLPEVRSCYTSYGHGRAAAGALRLELIIQPGGSVARLGVTAPGVDPSWLTRLGGCLRQHVRAWHFPARGSVTTAMMPFLFHKADAPGAGPIESCWDPRGCPPGERETPR